MSTTPREAVATAAPAREAGPRANWLHPARHCVALLAAVEFTMLYAALHLAVALRFGADSTDVGEQFGEVMPRALLFAAVVWLCLLSMGLYRQRTRDDLAGQFRRTAVAFMLGGAALAVAYYLLPAGYTGRGVLALALALGFVMTATMRVLVLRAFNAEDLKTRVLVLGCGHRAALIERRMRRSGDRRNATIVGYVPVPGDRTHDGLPRIEAHGSLPELAARLRADEIVVGPDDRRGCLPMDELMACRVRGLSVIDLPAFFERETGKIQLDVVDPSWLVFSGGFRNGPLRAAAKRTFDVVAAGVLLLAALPVMLLTMLAILAESGWGAPVLYRQQRVGEGGRTFDVLKFRSMRTDAERDGVARWAASDDDRITRVGRVIRKLRIDELPQVVNVLRGEMSFVGPRPERPVFVESLSAQIPYYGLRHFVKPGITGWAQLRYAYGASVADAAEKLKFDLYYVKHQSMRFDVLILLQTVEVVLFGKGAR